MGNSGQIVACEQNEIRFQVLEHNLQKQGVSNTEARCTDATLIYKEFPEAFDRVLADVPCTAEGRIDLRKPRTWKFWSQRNIIMHAKLQRRLLRSAVRALKPGGRLVYSTCTLAPEENEEMVRWLLKEFPEMTLTKDCQRILPSKTQEGFFLATLEKAIKKPIVEIGFCLHS
jgi:16S rRNA (cytosine1407-C5)-methyltransferase